jgi:single-stranded-DNA-specific exonuclease
VSSRTTESASSDPGLTVAPAEWELAETPAAASRLEEAGYGRRLSHLLSRRGVEDESAAKAFLGPSTDDLHDPFLLDGMERAVGRLQQARAGGETVVVVGDYDVDGISATALLVAVFEACGMSAIPVLPHRMRDGYGFQPRQVEAARDAGAKVIVTADCGSHSHEAVNMAIAEGIDVIVTDHHIPGEEHPSEVVHINPHRPACSYPYPDLSGAGLAFKLATAFAERVGRPIASELLLRVACLGTVADMVPLRGENRTIAAVGLSSLESTRSAGLRALMQVAGVSGAVRAGDIGFRLGPRINAAGRMDSPDLALELLLTRDAQRAKSIALQLDDWNAQRQSAEAQVVAEATALFDDLDELPRLLVGWKSEWHRGVVGIAAGRVSRQFQRPTILLAVEGDLATGSGRSIKGVHLHDFLLPWKDRLERFGGHSQAIGMTAALSEIDTLRDEWLESAGEWDESVLIRRYRYEDQVAASEVCAELLGEIQQLEPFGIGNPRPVFRVGPLTRAGELRRFGKAHVSCRARDEAGGEVGLLGWRWGDRADLFNGSFEALGTISHDRYRNEAVLELVDVRSERPDA